MLRDDFGSLCTKKNRFLRCPYCRGGGETVTLEMYLIAISLTPERDAPTDEKMLKAQRPLWNADA